MTSDYALVPGGDDYNNLRCRIDHILYFQVALWGIVLISLLRGTKQEQFYITSAAAVLLCIAFTCWIQCTKCLYKFRAASFPISLETVPVPKHEIIIAKSLRLVPGPVKPVPKPDNVIHKARKALVIDICVSAPLLFICSFTILVVAFQIAGHI